MPPCSAGQHDTRQRWESARQALRDRGLETPDYDERGMLFVLEADGRVSNVEPLLLTSARQVRKSLKRLLTDAQPAGGLYTAIARTRRRNPARHVLGLDGNLRQLSTYGVALLGLVVARPVVGFNPSESWGVVFGRSFASQTMAEQTTGDALAIAGRYRSIAALVPPDKDRAQTALVLVHGLAKIDDETRRVYLTAFGSMLERVDTRTCAAIARDQNRVRRDENRADLHSGEHERLYQGGAGGDIRRERRPASAAARQTDDHSGRGAVHRHAEARGSGAIRTHRDLRER